MGDSPKLTPQTIENAVQSVLDMEIISNAVDKHPTLGFLLGRAGVQGKANGIKLPDDGILSDGGVEGPDRRAIASHTWEPAIHTGLPVDDTKRMVWYDTAPADNNNDGTKGLLSRIKRPRFCRTDLSTPVQVWDRDIEQMRNAYGRAAKAGNESVAAKLADDLRDIVKGVVVEKTLVQLVNIDTDLWKSAALGIPTSEDEPLWDHQHSWASMCHDDNQYGGKDRSLPANAHWKGNTIAEHLPADIDAIKNYVQYSNGASGLRLSSKGIRPNLWVVGTVLFPIFEAQARARNLHIYSGEEIPGVLVYGQKQEAIKLNAETLIICDPSCPTKGVNGATKNAMLQLSTGRLVVSALPGKNFRLSNLEQLGKRPGEPKALYGTLDTELGVWTRHPWAHVWAEDVG